MHALFRRFLTALVKRGNLTVEFADDTRLVLGDGSGTPVHVRFADGRAPFDLLRNPELVIGELFTDGRLLLKEGTIFDLLALVSRNSARGAPPRWLKAVRRVRDAGQFLRPRNRRVRSRSNVERHYDLDDRMYRLFLDPDRQYSCAYFERADATLDEAQLAKKRHIAAKLLLEPGQTVLDIGCGWGGMALYMARFCGSDVTGITLSQEQHVNAQARAAEAGFADKVRFRIEDYRDTQGPFDRIVSIGMFEHVGRAFYDEYFASVAKLLKPDGVALIHTITRQDGPGTLNPWVTKYIFPGAHIPALSEIAPSIERAGLFITDIESLRMHYAETLAAWRANFLAHRDEAKAVYDERFCRMWEFYLAAAECSFRFEGECVYQFQLSRRHDAVPITRDYMFDTERRLRSQDTRDRASEWKVA